MTMTSENDHPRVGVFLCHCGNNIAGVVDIPQVAEFARGLPHVALVEENIHTCSSEGIAEIMEAIKEHDIERVVVASCTPRTHEPLFRDACEGAGLNRYLFQMVNIREHDSWIHKQDPEAATEKAEILVRMAVAKAKHLEPEEEPVIDIEPASLVIGAGVSGMVAALSLANQGFDVYLVEKEAEVGGVLRDLNKLYPTEHVAADFLQPIIDAVEENEKIRLFTSSEVTEVKGYFGSFDANVSEKGGEPFDLKVGTIIVATGAESFEPEGYYGYGESDSVVTQLELEQRLREGDPKMPEKVVMIQCVGAMEEKGRTYCSRICCGVALKNALLIKELQPSTDVYILYRDLQAYGRELEEHYREALGRRVKFINYIPERPPQVSVSPEGGLEVVVHDTLTGIEIAIDPGLLVLSTPLVPRSDTEELAYMLRVPMGSDGFFLEAHPKMRPVDFSSDGIYLCGTAHGPKTVAESVTQANAAASRAAIPMAKRRVHAEAVTAVVDLDLCVACGACADSCPYNAIELGSFSQPNVIEAACKGCGVCAVECPMGAMQLRYFKDIQMVPAVEGLLTPQKWMSPKREQEPVIICFACRWCSYAAADLAGIMRLEYPVNVRIILVPCTGRVDVLHILTAFERGADGVMLAGCLKEQCHYIDGNLKAERRVEVTKKALDVIGIGGDRLEMIFCSAGMPMEFAESVTKFTERIKEKGQLGLEKTSIQAQSPEK